MSFEALLCAILATYALLNFIMLPRLTQAWKANHTASKVARSGFIAAVQFARDAAFLAAVMYLTFAIFTLLLRFSFGHNAEVLEWAVSSAASLHERLEKIDDFAEHWFFLFPLALLVFVHWRTQRSKFNGRFERLVDDECDRLNEERRHAPQQWDSLAADEKMQAVEARIAEAQEKLAALAKQQPMNRSERRRLLKSIVMLREQRTDLDYERRINMQQLDVVDDQSKEPVWRRILLSKGLFSDLTGFSKALSRLSLAMLSLALIGVAGNAGFAKDLWERAIHLDELRVEARIKQAEDRWKDHPKADQTASLSDSDHKVISHLANDFARALSRNPNWRTLQSSLRARQNLERTVARRAILEEVSLPNANGSERQAFSDGLNPAQQQVLHDAVSADPHESRFAHIVADRHGSEIKSWFGTKWQNVKVVITQHARSYYEPVDLDDLQGELIDRIVSVAFDATGSETASDVVNAARDGMSDATKEAVREAVETEFHSVLEDLYDGKPYTETIDKVRKADIPISKAKVEDLAALTRDRHLPDERSYRDQMAADTGSWKDPNSGGGSGTGGGGGSGPWHNGPDVASSPRPTDPTSPPSPTSGGSSGGEANTLVDEIAQRATNHGQYSLPEESVGALAQYEDHFPRSVQSQGATRLGQVLAQYRTGTDAAAFARVAALNVERAGSFTMLRGFSKVGGVLIGRTPHGSADIRDIEWKISGRNVSIGLIDAARHASWFGPFDESLVHQALGYSADGRPVAVTMTIARPVSGLKIFLHPSLVDTPLGCRVQQLDRLVDIHAGLQLPEREKMTERYMAQVAVYNVALGKRTEAVAHRVSNGNNLQKQADTIVESFTSFAAEGLRDPDLFSTDSILRRKPEFFEPALIKVAKSCQNPDITAFEACVLDSYTSSRGIRELKEDVLRGWSFAPAEIQPWSGVRERDYAVSNDLNFLHPPGGNGVADDLWPFDFIVQIAFTSAAVNLPEKQKEVYVDRQPIEFDPLQPRIESLVKAGIEKDGFRPQFDDLRNFAVLQRLFRAALNGNLGSQFPTLKLAQLTHATAGHTPYVHTRRWNSSSVVRFDFLLRRAQRAQDPSQPWMQSAALRLPACHASLLQTLARPNSPADPSACDFTQFRSAAIAACRDNAGKTTPGCTWRSVVAESITLPRIEQIESAFGVLEDEQQDTNDPSCPPLETPSVSLRAKR